MQLVPKETEASQPSPLDAMGDAVFHVEQTARLMAFIANDADEDVEKIYLFDTVGRHLSRDTADLRAAFEALYRAGSR